MTQTTESASLRYAALEQWSSTELVQGIVEGQFVAIGAVQAAAPLLAEAIDRIAERLRQGGRLIYMGAGTSGRIAVQDAVELPPTFNWPDVRLVTLMAGGPGTVGAADEAAEDREDLAVTGLDAVGVGPKDVVIGVAASGSTPYTLAGLRHARECGALTVGVFNNRAGTVASVAELPILLETGAEILSGSTRMKAGTAQKVALNILSTGVMIRLGYVHRGMMVEMRPTNAKLRERAAGIVASLAEVPLNEARSALDGADGNIKLATVMLACSLDATGARQKLDAVSGNLGLALGG